VSNLEKVPNRQISDGTNGKSLGREDKLTSVQSAGSEQFLRRAKVARVTMKNVPFSGGEYCKFSRAAGGKGEGAAGSGVHPPGTRDAAGIAPPALDILLKMNKTVEAKMRASLAIKAGTYNRHTRALLHGQKYFGQFQ